MRTSKLNCFNEDQDWTNDEIRTILGCVMWQQSQSYLVCVIPKKTVVATHENYDSAISSLIVQVICCVWLPVLGRSSTWPIKKKKNFFRQFFRAEKQPPITCSLFSMIVDLLLYILTICRIAQLHMQRRVEGVSCAPRISRSSQTDPSHQREIFSLLLFLFSSQSHPT